MNRCRQARRYLLERSLSALPETLETALTRHLNSCEACRREAVLESQISRDLAQLRTPLPFRVNARARTMDLIARTPRPLGLRARASWRAILAAAALPAALLALSLVLLPGVRTGLGALRELATPLGVLPGLGSAALRMLAGLARGMQPLLLGAMDGLGRALSWVAPSSTLALILIALSAAGTMSFLILRDFLNAPPIRVGKE